MGQKQTGTQQSFADSLQQPEASPVECLGMHFKSDAERRDCFTATLKEKLQDPSFRKIAGFPIASDEDILRVSDPPYYTACPNPFLFDFVREHAKQYQPDVQYSREPFSADVHEGKNDPIYNAHTYHTKVPPKAIMRYILNYSDPGDIVLDGFAGTGMTGVAAHLCGDRTAVESIGYGIDREGSVLDESGQVFSRLGARYSILNDLSPAATFIAQNYNTPSGLTGSEFRRAATEILDRVAIEYGHLFDLSDQKHRHATLLYSVWSDVFFCPNCTQELCYWDVAVDTKQWQIRASFSCSSCNEELTRNELKRAWISYHDKFTGSTVRRAKKVRVWDVWTDGRSRHEGAVKPEFRNELHDQKTPYTPEWCPTATIPDGDKTGDPFGSGIRYVHQYWSPRTLVVLARFWKAASQSHGRHLLWFMMTSALDRVSLRNGFRPQHKNNKSRELGGPLPGNLYIPIFSVELNPIEHLRDRIQSVSRMLDATRERGRSMISTQSTSEMALPDNCVDYVFVDPPFGSNLMYSELNYALESWLRVATNSGPEAIVNGTQAKTERDYTQLMRDCFARMYRCLKPGRWITVEFHNSRNSIWTAIQEALTEARFIVADVRTLSRNLASLNQITCANAVKQDLIISAYKPTADLERSFELEAGTDAGVWDFVREHLKHVPVFVSRVGKGEMISERQAYLLFDRMVAFHVQRGITVSISAADFYTGLAQRFPERDGMYFLPEQLPEYDRKRLSVSQVEQLELYVSNEPSAIQWLRQQLSVKPQSFQDLHPQFLKELGGWQKHERPLELRELLEQNFLLYDGSGPVPTQIHSYLSSNFKDLRNLTKNSGPLRARGKDRWYVPDPAKAGDLEKLRERALLREFEDYRNTKQKILKVFRIEAMRTGFRRAWQQNDYTSILDVAEKLPDDVVQEDPMLLMWYTNSLTRSGRQS